MFPRSRPHMPWQDRIKRDWDRPRQSVLAFEPNPDYAFFARWMLRDRAEVHEVALSDASGRGTLYVPLSDQGVPSTSPAACPRARKEIVVPCNAESGPRRIDQALMRALARARSWMRALRRGEYADTAQIAQRFGLSDPHVRRLLRFAYLAPDIVEAIVEGRQPRSLTVKLLLRGIPLAWSDQRAAFRFSH